MNGFIKLHRKAFDHILWTESRSFSKFEAWLDLLQLAAFAPSKRIIRGHVIEIDEGECIASLRYLGQRWQWSKNKAASFMALLESQGMLGRRIGHGETILIICNYKRYAGSKDAERDTEKDDAGTVSGQRRDKIEEDKEIREREKPRPKINRPTLSQALSAAANLGITPQKATEWWNAREASEWIKGMAGGGISPVGSNWQADLTTYATRGGMGNDRKFNGQTNGHKSKTTTADQYGI